MLARLAPLAVVGPLLAAALLGSLGRHLPRAARQAVALLAAAGATALCALLARATAAGPGVTWLGGWTPRGAVAPGIAFAADPLGAGLGALAGLLTCAALLFARRRFEQAEGRLPALLLLFLAALCGFGLTADLFDLFVFFELMSVAAYALAGYRSEDPTVLEGALHFGVVNTAGACLVLLGLGLAYGATGALSLAQLHQALPAAPPALARAAFALLCTGFLVKAAAVPFHFWLADAHAVAPTPACVLFSGVMVQAGIYAVARLSATAFAGLLPPGGAGPGAALLLLAGLSAVAGALLAFAQRHLKRLLAFSTVAHAGGMLAGVALATPAGLAAAALQVVAHGLAKGALFLAAGIVLHRLRSVDELALRGRGRRLAVVAVVLGAGGLALAGAPPFAGAAADAALHRALEEAGWGGLALVLQASAVVTGAAVLRAALRIGAGLGPRAPEAPEVGGEVDERAETRRSRGRTPPGMNAAALGLLALGAVAGAGGWLTRPAGEAAARFLEGDRWSAAVLGTPLPAPAPPPLAPPPTVSRGEAWSRGALQAALALGLALAVLGRRRLPRPVREAGARALGPPLRALRALHTGRIGESVAWLALGGAALGAAFLLL